MLSATVAEASGGTLRPDALAHRALDVTRRHEVDVDASTRCRAVARGVERLLREAVADLRCPHRAIVALTAANSSTADIEKARADDFVQRKEIWNQCVSEGNPICKP